MQSQDVRGGQRSTQLWRKPKMAKGSLQQLPPMVWPGQSRAPCSLRHLGSNITLHAPVCPDHSKGNKDENSSELRTSCVTIEREPEKKEEPDRHRRGKGSKKTLHATKATSKAGQGSQIEINILLVACMACRNRMDISAICCNICAICALEYVF